MTYSLNDFPILLTLCSLKFCNLSIHIKNPFLLCNLFDPHRRIQRFGKWRGGGGQIDENQYNYWINYNIRVKAKQKKYWNICNAPTCDTRQVHVYFLGHVLIFQMYFREKVMVSLSVCCKRFCKVRVCSRKVPLFHPVCTQLIPDIHCQPLLSYLSC